MEMHDYSPHALEDADYPGASDTPSYTEDVDTARDMLNPEKSDGQDELDDPVRDIDTLVAHIKAGTPDTGVTLIDHTPDSSVYRVPHDAQDRILRISTPTEYRNDGKTATEGFWDRVNALQQGRHVHTLEQLVEYTPESEAVLTLAAAGDRMDQLPPALAREITYDHFRQVAAAINSCCCYEPGKPGIVLDGDPSNIFVDAQEGFTITDYGLSDEPSRLVPLRQYAEFLYGVGSALATETTGEPRQAWIAMFERGLDVMRETYGVDPHAASKSIAGLHEELLG